MIKVLQKTFDLFEYVAMSPHPVPPREAAEALNLPQPTTVRLLRDLTELGYLEQSGPRKGYRPGPVPFLLAGGKLYDDDYMRFVSSMVRECAREMGQSVQFAVRRRNFRYILCHDNYNPGFAVDTARVRFRDLYHTGSGRMLLAFSSEPELEELISELGLPPPHIWLDASHDRARLRNELGKIRTAREVEFTRSLCGNFHVYARPVFRNRAFSGAVAANWEIGLSPERNREYKKQITELAARLSEARKLVVG